MYAHTYTHTHTLMLTPIHTYTHIHTHLLTHIHTSTHTHKSSWNLNNIMIVYSLLFCSITNLGGHGIKKFSAIINPPQSAILAVGSLEAVPTLASNGKDFEVTRMMTVTMSCEYECVYMYVWVWTWVCVNVYMDVLSCMYVCVCMCICSPKWSTLVFIGCQFTNTCSIS